MTALDYVVDGLLVGLMLGWAAAWIVDEVLAARRRRAQGK
jgi:hypothetical protein